MPLGKPVEVKKIMIWRGDAFTLIALQLYLTE
jgi:hypothetical protein